jgi:ribosomal-protein-serine acetyltransferase
MGPELRTSFELSDEVILRTFREDDAELVYQTVDRNRRHLQTYMHWMTSDYSRASATEFITNSIASAGAGESLSFGIFRGEILIGSIGFVHFDRKARKTEIGYWIDKSEEGKGLVSAACKLLIEYAFGELGLNRIEIRCSSENVRSAAIPISFGFEKEGVLRQAELRDGKLHDFIIYGLLAAEWRTREI